MRANDKLHDLVIELRKIRELMERLVGDERLLSGRVDKLEATREGEDELAPHNYKEKNHGRSQPKD